MWNQYFFFLIEKLKMKHLIHEKDIQGQCWKSVRGEFLNLMGLVLKEDAGRIMSVMSFMHNFPSSVMSLAPVSTWNPLPTCLVASSAGTVVLISPSMHSGIYGLTDFIGFDLWSSPWCCCVCKLLFLLECG